MPVMSLRLSEKELKRLKAMAKSEDKEQSSEIRELLADGLRYKMLLRYKEGKVSIGILSKMLEINISEALDLLASFGIPMSVTYDDYLLSREAAKKYIH
jgi:predicted HTH domain antitoxin